MRVAVEVDADRTSAQFKQARRDVYRRTRRGLKAAGEKVVLPTARRNAGGLRVQGRSTAASLVVRSTTRGAVITTSMRGKLGRAVGLQEFGGTVTTPIRPRRAKAILTPYGPRAAVTGPRHYKGRHFLTEAAGENIGRIEEAIKDEVLKAFAGLDVR